MLALLLGLLPVGAVSLAESDVSNFEYTNCGTYISITRYSGTEKRVVVPETIEGLPVEQVGFCSISDAVNPYVREIVLPSTVRELNQAAFNNLVYLKSIEGLEYVKRVGNYAFASCGIQEAVFSDALEYIGYDAFSSSKLVRVTIPDDTELPWRNPFDCGEFKEITLLDGSGDAKLALLDGVLVSADGTTLICYPAGWRESTYTIPDQITTLQGYALYLGQGEGRLTEVYIPETVESFVNYTFGVRGKCKLFVVPDSAGHAYAESFAQSHMDVEVVQLEEGSLMQTLGDRVKEIVAANTSDAMSDLEKAVAMIDWCAENVVYDSEYVCFSPYDVLFDGKGICCAYAEAYRLLMEEMEIPCVVVGNYDHAFNAIQIDGDWIYADPTGCCGDDPMVRYYRFAFEDTMFEYLYGGIDADANADITSSTAKYHYFYTSGALDEAIAEARKQVSQGLSEGKTAFSFEADTNLLVYDSYLSGRIVASLLSEESWSVAGAEASLNCSYDDGVYYVVVGGDAPVEESEFVYDFVNGMARITGYRGAELSVTVPSQIDGYTVGYMGTAFSGNLDVERVVLPETIVGIDSNAFHECVSLQEINFPDALKTIGDSAFEKCYLLESDVILPEGLEYLGRLAFADCSYISHASLPGSLSAILDMTFMDCLRLTEVELSEGLISIGGAALSGCESLKQITLPQSLQRIGNGAFSSSGIGSLHIPENVTFIGEQMVYNCKNIQSVTVAEGNSCFEMDSGILYFKEGGVFKTLKFTLPTSSVTELTVPDTVVQIDGYAFDGHASLTSLHIPASVRMIGERAFTECASLRKVTMDDGVESMGYAVFATCPALEEVWFADTITDIDSTVLSSCVNVSVVNVPRAMTAVAMDVYRVGPQGLQLYVHEGVTSIAGLGFYKNYGEVCIHGIAKTYAQSFAEENGYAFVCEHSEIIEKGLPATHKTAGLTDAIQCSACGEVISSQEILPVREDMVVATLPEGLESLEQEALSASGVQCIVIPEGCLSIGGCAFAGCEALEVVEIQGMETELAQDAFSLCRDDLVILTNEGSAAYAFAVEKQMTVVAYPQEET